MSPEASSSSSNRFGPLARLRSMWQERHIMAAKRSLRGHYRDAEVAWAYLQVPAEYCTEEVTLLALRSTASYELFDQSPITYSWIDTPRYELSDGSVQTSGHAGPWVSEQAKSKIAELAGTRPKGPYDVYRDRILGSGTDYRDKLIHHIPPEHLSNVDVLRTLLIVVSIKPLKRKGTGQRRVVDQTAEYQEWVSDGSYGGERGARHHELVRHEISHMEDVYEVVAGYARNELAIAKLRGLPEPVQQAVLETLPPALKDLVEKHTADPSDPGNAAGL